MGVKAELQAEGYAPCAFLPPQQTSNCCAGQEDAVL